MRNLKTLGLALMAVFALGAVVASASSAQGKITSDGPFTLTATETGPETANRLVAFGAFVQCPGSTYDGHKYNETHHKFLTSGATTVTLTPTYKQTKTATEPNCEGPFGWRATIHMNGCDYVLHIGETTVSPADTYKVTADIVCPPGKEITVTLWTSEALHTSEPTKPFCVLHVPPQNGLTGADATDTTNGDFDVSGEFHSIKLTRTSQASDVSPVLCPNSETTTGKFAIDVTVKADNEAGGSTSISLSDS